MSALRADVTLSTGRVITHRPSPNGAQEAIVKGCEASPMTDAEWVEFCEITKARSLGARVDITSSRKKP